MNRPGTDHARPVGSPSSLSSTALDSGSFILHPRGAAAMLDTLSSAPTLAEFDDTDAVDHTDDDDHDDQAIRRAPGCWVPARFRGEGRPGVNYDDRGWDHLLPQDLDPYCPSLPPDRP